MTSHIPRCCLLCMKGFRHEHDGVIFNPDGVENSFNQNDEILKHLGSKLPSEYFVEHPKLFDKYNELYEKLFQFLSNPFVCTNGYSVPCCELTFQTLLEDPYSMELLKQFYEILDVIGC